MKVLIALWQSLQIFTKNKRKYFDFTHCEKSRIIFATAAYGAPAKISRTYDDTEASIGLG